MQRLVCDREVWRWLLRGVEEFTDERLEELAVFGSKKGPEVMAEVLLAFARTFEPVGDRDGCYLVTVSAEGWGPPGTIKCAILPFWGDLGRGRYNLKCLNKVSEALGAKYKIVAVDMATCEQKTEYRCMDLGCRALGPNFSCSFLNQILARVGEQAEGMDCLKMCAWNDEQNVKAEKLFFSLMKVTKQWRIGRIFGGTSFVKLFADLPTDSAAAGQIDHISLDEKSKSSSLDVIKRIWEISKHVDLKQATVSGGRGADPEAGWQAVVDYFQGSN